jgi:hypothetical protein
MQIHNDLLKLRQTEKRITSEILDKLQSMEDCKGYLKIATLLFLTIWFEAYNIPKRRLIKDKLVCAFLENSLR